MTGFQFVDATVTSERPSSEAQIVPGETWLRGPSDELKSKVTATDLNRLKANLNNLFEYYNSANDEDNMLLNAIKTAVEPYYYVSTIGPPTTSDDGANTSGRGVFVKRSRWFDEVGNESYLCMSNAPNEAKWVKTSLTLDELGSAATLNVGTGANEVVQLNGSGKLPALDASQLVNLPGGGLANDSVLLQHLTNEVVNRLIPVGARVGWDHSAPPSGWLIEDGSAISRVAYAALFAHQGDMFGDGDGSTTFNLRDPRGRFSRYVDGGAGIDPDAASRADRGDGTTGDAAGTLQEDTFKAHQHMESLGSHGAVFGASTDQTNPLRHTLEAATGSQSSPLTQSVGGNETRPKNIYEFSIIKY